jgi:hypothetical protein
MAGEINYVTKKSEGHSRVLTGIAHWKKQESLPSVPPDINSNDDWFDILFSSQTLAPTGHVSPTETLLASQYFEFLQFKYYVSNC